MSSYPRYTSFSDFYSQHLGSQKCPYCGACEFYISAQHFNSCSYAKQNWNEYRRTISKYPSKHSPKKTSKKASKNADKNSDDRDNLVLSYLSDEIKKLSEKANKTNKIIKQLRQQISSLEKNAEKKENTINVLLARTTHLRTHVYSLEKKAERTITEMLRSNLPSLANNGEDSDANGSDSEDIYEPEEGAKNNTDQYKLHSNK
jgi:chromosome segregation ATPase